ncbi:metallopeptidase family protein [Propionimicrobium sp. PCR01-08-3]|uniref:metallopeptidase family protein n=1 Tax=Propionimicrobium sp. PCR01-08-3 TaxID=3052086 RepID=UPI00255C2EC7|nr:metallopeptidase family protein [Propionimicrobium sp. PCR01-08-3]WIY83323.1 metallopeptidase family protein [Propionimicrobium sp. PCR01-08-3]
MTDRRDRHGRGMRGPLALPNPLTGAPVRIPGHLSAAEFFVQAVTESVSRLMETAPDALVGVDIGVEDVPSATFDWAYLDRVPLAAAIDATTTRPARIVIFRRPLERRAADREDLYDLVHITLVEQLSALTGRSMHDLDPEVDDD